MTKLALLFSVLAPLSFGQTAPAPASAETQKKASIEGVVINEITKEPLRRADIKLMRSGKDGAVMGNNAALSAVTDAAGKFHIDNIEPGEYYLNHFKAGYVHSRTTSGSSTSLLKLSAGESLTDLHYLLLPQSVVAGRVIDDEGEPVQGATVMLMSPQYRRGSARLSPAGFAQTNDRGEYRIIDVPPGKYYIQAKVQRMMMGGVMPTPSAAAGAPKAAFVSTYYPSAAESAQATRIEPRPGLELSGQDIILRKEKVVRISGKALDLDGSPARQTYVMLMAVDEFMGSSSDTGSPVDDKGNFTISDVLPGQYNLVANRTDGQDRQSAHAAVTVGDVDVTNVVLQALPGLEVKGVIVLEGSEKKDLDFSMFSIALSSNEPSPIGVAGTQAKSDGSFTIPRVSPGRYTLIVHSRKGAHYVQSILAGPEDVFGKEVDAVALAAGTLRVVVRTDWASVSGTVEISEDRKASLGSPTVVLLPTDLRMRSTDEFKVAQFPQIHGFEFKNVRPGEYLAFAFEDFDYRSLEDPEVFAAVKSKATKVSLGRGESKELALKMIPWPEQFADRIE